MDIAYACLFYVIIRVRVCRCVRVCVSWCAGTPHSSFSGFFLLSLLAASAAVPCLLFHTVPQAFELSPLWQPRYNRSRTASLCGPLVTYCACVDIAYACVCCVCHGHVYSYVRVCALICVLAPQFSAVFFVLFALLAVCCCCCRIMPSVYHRASSSRALYFVAATVQQQSRRKFVWIACVRVLALHMRVCDVR